MSDQRASNLRLFLQIIIGLFIAIGAYYAKEVKDDIGNLRTEMNRMQVANAAAEASRFSATDWVRVKDTLDNRFIEVDKKINGHDIVLTGIAGDLKAIRSEQSAVTAKLDKVLSYHN